MKIKFSPQINERTLVYSFEEDVVKASLDGIEDIFDFSDMPDGKVGNPHEDIKSILDTQIILSVERVKGELRVELLNFIGFDATYEERFPEWFEVKSDGKD